MLPLCKHMLPAAFTRPSNAHDLWWMAARTATQKSLPFGLMCFHFVPFVVVAMCQRQCRSKAMRCRRIPIIVEPLYETLYFGVVDSNQVITMYYSAKLMVCFPLITIWVTPAVMAILLSQRWWCRCGQSVAWRWRVGNRWLRVFHPAGQSFRQLDCHWAESMISMMLFCVAIMIYM